MRIQRTLPPAAAPLTIRNLIHGLGGMCFGKRYLKMLEGELREYFGVQHVFLVSSGKAALVLILKALRSLHPERDEVLIPAYTCYSVPSAIKKAGLKVALCDIDPETFDFDYRLLQNAVHERTLCVVTGNLFGIPADMERVQAVCKVRGTAVVEDAAQAMGARYHQRLIGTIGEVGFLSLGRGKNVTCGSGGIIITKSAQIAEALQKEIALLKRPSYAKMIQEFLKMVVLWFFITPGLYWFPAGLSFLRLGETVFYKDFPIEKLSGMQAGLLGDWRRALEESNRTRRTNGAYYCQLLQTPREPGDEVSYLRYPLLVHDVETRQQVYALAIRSGAGLSTLYPKPVHEIDEMKQEFIGQSYPGAKSVSERLLTLPTHHLVSEQDRRRIASLLSGIRLDSPPNSEPGLAVA